ncbi:MAG: hydrogenase maturation protease [Planctomycetota bacterium]
MKKIICIGNMFIKEDAAGPLVCQRLKNVSLPDGVELIDGGMGGLNLLSQVEDAEQVVFVDAVHGFTQQPGVMVLDREAAVECATSVYDHAAGLSYLLKVLPSVITGTIPEIMLVGVEGNPTPSLVKKAAELAIELCLTHEQGLSASSAEKPTPMHRDGTERPIRDPNLSTQSS